MMSSYSVSIVQYLYVLILYYSNGDRRGEGAGGKRGERQEGELVLVVSISLVVMNHELFMSSVAFKPFMCSIKPSPLSPVSKKYS